MKTFLYIIIGVIAAYVLYKTFVPQNEKTSESQTNENLKALLKTHAAQELLSSPEFSAVLVTDEFRKLMKGIGDEYIKTLTQSVV